MKLKEVFDFSLIDKSPYTEHAQALWENIGESTNHVEVFANCFRFLKEEQLIEYARLVREISFENILTRQSVTEIRVKPVLFDDALKNELINRIIRLLEKFNLKNTDNQIDIPVRDKELKYFTEQVKLKKTEIENEFCKTLGIELNEAPKLPEAQSNNENWLEELLMYIGGSGEISWVPTLGKAEEHSRKALLKILFEKAERLSVMRPGETLLDRIKVAGLIEYFENIVLKEKAETGLIIENYFLNNIDQLNLEKSRLLLATYLDFSSNIEDLGDSLRLVFRGWYRKILNSKGHHYLSLSLKMKTSIIREEVFNTIMIQLQEKTVELFDNILLLTKDEFPGPRLTLKFHYPVEVGLKDEYANNMISTGNRPVLTIKGNEFIFREFYPFLDNGKEYLIKSGTKKPNIRNGKVEISGKIYLESVDNSSIFWKKYEGENIFYKSNIFSKADEITTFIWSSNRGKWKPVSKRIDRKAIFNFISKENDWSFSFMGFFSFNRKWKFIYTINEKYESNSLTDRFKLGVFTIPAGGGFSGIGRADSVTDEDYLWSCGGNFSEYLTDRYDNDLLGQYLGRFIGLNPDNYIPPKDIVPSNDTALSFIKYHFITHKEKEYVQINLPGFIDSSTLGVQKSMIAEVKPIMDIFNFRYYRLIDKTTNTIVKACEKNAPLTPAYPASFQIEENFKWLHQKLYSHEDRSNKYFRSQRYKNERDLIKPNQDLRDSANSVMKRYLKGAFKNLIPADFTGSATDFTNNFFLEETQAREIWDSIKYNQVEENEEGLKLPSRQEWCHLQANAFNGPSEHENFVSGSKHCNTEQLAIESAQSYVIKKNDPHSQANRYELRSTAYLFEKNIETETRKRKATSLAPGDAARIAKKRKIEGNSTTADDVTMDEESDDSSDTSINTDSSQGDSKVPLLETPIPISAFIRYKIHKGPDKKTVKIFDYTFEGQSEFFDRNQFLIIQNTVRFVLLGQEAFDLWFTEKLRARETDRMDID